MSLLKGSPSSPVMVWEFLPQQDEAGAGMGRASGDPHTLTIVFARCGNVPLLSHRLAVLSKEPGGFLELENFQDPALTPITGVVAIN